MFRPRIIPTLLLKDGSLVKSVKFKNYTYIGDPMNAVKLFNDFKADELVFLDIDASKNNKLISLDIVRAVSEEANMPFSVGGGIKTIEDIHQIIGAGAEKVVLSSKAMSHPNFIKEASDIFGSSTIVVCIDIKKNFFGSRVVYTNNGKKSSGYSPKEAAKLAEQNGAGEIIVQSIDKDGTMSGYDLDLIKEIATSVTIPVIALGGAGNFEDMKVCFKSAGASALAAGSYFVYHDAQKGVLISYPDSAQIQTLRQQ